MLVILAQVLAQRRLAGIFTDRDSLHLEITFIKRQELTTVTSLLNQYCKFIKLNRFEDQDPQVFLFLVKPKSSADLEKLRVAIKKLDKNAQLTMLEYQPLI